MSLMVTMVEPSVTYQVDATGLISSTFGGTTDPPTLSSVPRYQSASVISSKVPECLCHWFRNIKVPLSSVLKKRLSGRDKNLSLRGPCTNRGIPEPFERPPSRRDRSVAVGPTGSQVPRECSGELREKTFQNESSEKDGPPLPGARL